MDGKPPPPPPPPATPRVSMFRRLLVRVSASEKFVADGKERDKDEKPQPPPAGEGDAAGSVGLDRMVLSFMEDAAIVEQPLQGRCNCFNGSNTRIEKEGFEFLPLRKLHLWDSKHHAL